jgi:hypothetical protein
MLSKLSRFLTIATLTTLTCVITHPANAKPADMDVNAAEMESVSSLNLDELINEAYWQNTGDFWEDTNPGGQLNTIFGWGSFPLGSFPENEISRDGLLIYTIVADYFKQLQEREPTIRTRDLANPFDASIRDGIIDPEPEPTLVPTPYQMNEPIPESQPVRGLY